MLTVSGQEEMLERLSQRAGSVPNHSPGAGNIAQCVSLLCSSESRLLSPSRGRGSRSQWNQLSAHVEAALGAVGRWNAKNPLSRAGFLLSISSPAAGTVSAVLGALWVRAMGSPTQIYQC